MEKGIVGQGQPMRMHAEFLGRLVFCTVLLSVVAFLSAFAQPDPGFVPVWPCSGIGLALLWQHGARYWPAFFVSNTISDTAIGTPMLAASGVGAL